MKILIVEDDAVMQKALWDWFTFDGVEVPDARDAETALAFIDVADAVLCDGWFPSDGKLQKSWPLVYGAAMKLGKPFVLMSCDPELVEQARATGVEAVHKPFAFEAVERKLGMTA